MTVIIVILFDKYEVSIWLYVNNTFLLLRMLRSLDKLAQSWLIWVP